MTSPVSSLQALVVNSRTFAPGKSALADLKRDANGLDIPASLIRTYVWPRGCAQKQGLFWRTIRTAHVVRRKRIHPGMIALELATLPARRARDNPWFFATPFANTNTCNWIYRLPANPGNAEGRRPAAHPGLGPWVGARVASPRCPILRPGDLSVAGNTLIGQFPSPRSGPDAWQRSAPASVCSWTC